MQAYPGRGNPVLDALRGEISVRQLRVMLENLPDGNPIRWEFNGHQWGESEWLGWDLDTQLRALRADYYNSHRKKGAEEWRPDLLPNPKTAETQQHETRTPAQVQAERDHFRAVLNRAVVK